MLLIFRFFITGSHASVDGRSSLLKSMKERLEVLEESAQLTSTYPQLGRIEKKLELYIVKNDKLLQENKALKERVDILEGKHSELASTVAILKKYFSDMQRQNDNCQKEVLELKKLISTDFVSNQKLNRNNNPAEKLRATTSDT